MFRNIMTNHFSSFWTKLALSLTSPILIPHNKMIASNANTTTSLIPSAPSLSLLYTWTIIGWGAFTTVHIINCLPQTTAHNKSLIKLLHDRVWNYSYFLVCLFCYTSHENLSLNLAFVVFLVIVSVKKNIVVRTHQTLSSVSHFFQSPSSLPP